MLTILGGRHRFCDGISRRSFLRIGSLALGGLALPQVLEAEQTAGSGKRHKSIIMVFLPGGPPHQDMFDLKPDAPDGIRGEFSPISTAVPGIQICELLLQIASRMNKLAIIRSIVGSGGSHEAYQCLSGHPRLGAPLGGWPALGAVVSKLQGPVRSSVPPFVGLSSPMGHMPWADPGGPGFLGLGYAPFTPNRGGRTPISLEGMTLDRMQDRRALLSSFDSFRREVDRSHALVEMNQFKQRAFDLLTSSRLAEALDVSREDPRVYARYGRGNPVNRGDGGHRLTEQFVIARRLVEAGVRCVTLAFGRWDTHSNNFKVMREDMPLLDRAVAALVDDLAARGLEEDVSVIVWGEFGRSPQINPQGGRDHWPRVSCALLAGGGMRMGQVIGATDKVAASAVNRPVHYQEIFATLYQRMGIDPGTFLKDTVSRPQRIVDGAYGPIPELV